MILPQGPISKPKALVKNMLSNLGFFHDEENFLLLFKERVNDHFIQNWHQRLNDSNRALFYRRICIF